MNRLAIFLLAISVVVFGLIALCVVGWYMVDFPTHSYRYRMTVNVDVDGQTRSASSVIEVRLRKQDRVPTPGLPVHPSVTGEAVYVDLGAGRNVTALLASGKNASNVDYPYQIVPELARPSFGDRALLEFSTLTGRWDLPEKDMPAFVTFQNLADPTTARIVRPDEFDQIFGPQVRLSGVVIQMTKDPVTQTIQKIFPWIGNYLVETEFERTLRKAERGGGPAMTPGMNLRRER
jgi:hypothetical protein